MDTVTFISKETAERQKAQREWNLRVEAGLADVFRVFREIVPSQAARQLIVDWCDYFMGQPCIPSAEILKAARDQNRQQFKQDFAPVSKPVEEQRAEIIQRILVLLANGGRMTDHDLRAERARLQRGFTRDQLLRREGYILEAQRLNGICKNNGLEAVRQELREMRGDNLPQLVVLLPEEWTASELKKLAARDLQAFRKLVNEYGERQVNDRLAGRS